LDPKPTVSGCGRLSPNPPQDIEQALSTARPNLSFPDAFPDASLSEACSHSLHCVVAFPFGAGADRSHFRGAFSLAKRLREHPSNHAAMSFGRGPFKNWHMRVYFPSTNDECHRHDSEVAVALEGLGVQVVLARGGGENETMNAINHDCHRQTMWSSQTRALFNGTKVKQEPFDGDTVPAADFIIFRPLNSRLLARDESAVAVWARSGLPFHVIRLKAPPRHTATHRFSFNKKNVFSSLFHQGPSLAILNDRSSCCHRLVGCCSRSSLRLAPH
jgi:hypothetical protein